MKVALLGFGSPSLTGYRYGNPKCWRPTKGKGFGIDLKMSCIRLNNITCIATVFVLIYRMKFITIRISIR